MSGTNASKSEQQEKQGQMEPPSPQLSPQPVMSSAYAEILALQHSIGNEAVTALMQGAIPSMVQSVLNSSGQPIEPKVRTQMEARFGHDFSNVRLHTDSLAVNSAEALDAKAYTVGHNVVFGEGGSDPRTVSGFRLLAHELTHVVQQSRGGPAPPIVTNAPHERSADVAANSVATGNSTAPVPVAGATGVGIARAPKGDDDRRRRESNLRRRQTRDLQSEDQRHEDVDGGARQDRAEKRSRGEQRSAGQKRERQLEKSELEGELSSAGRASRKLRKAEAIALSPSGHKRSHKSKEKLMTQVEQAHEILNETVAPVDEFPKPQGKKSAKKAFVATQVRQKGKIDEALRASRRLGVRRQQKYVAGTIATPQHELPYGKSRFSQPDVSEGTQHTNLKSDKIHKMTVAAAAGRAREHGAQAKKNVSRDLPEGHKLKVSYLRTPSAEHQKAIKEALHAQGVEQVQFGTAVHSTAPDKPESGGETPKSKPTPKKAGGKTKSSGAPKSTPPKGQTAGGKEKKLRSGGPSRKKSASPPKGGAPKSTQTAGGKEKTGSGGTPSLKKTSSPTKGESKESYGPGGDVDVHTKPKTSTKKKPPVKQGTATKTPTGLASPNQTPTYRSADKEQSRRSKAEKTQPPNIKAERPVSDKYPYPREPKHAATPKAAAPPAKSSITPPASPSQPAKGVKPKAHGATVPKPSGPAPAATPPVPKASASSAGKSTQPAPAQMPKTPASVSPKAQPPAKATAPAMPNLQASAPSPKQQTPQSKSATAPKLGSARPGPPPAAGKQAGAPPSKAQAKQPAAGPKPGAAKAVRAPAARRGPTIQTAARPDGSVTAEVREKPGTSPARYEVTVKVMLGGSLSVSASQSGKRGSVGAHAGVSGSMSWSNTYDFSEEQKNAYLAAVNGNTSSPYQEIEAAKLWAKGNRDQAKSLLSQAGGKPPSAEDILNMPEGSSSSFSADTRAEGGVNASVKAVSVGASGSVSMQNGWHNEHRDGKYFVSRSFTVEKGKSFDASVSPGLLSLGYKGDSSTTHTTTASFEVKDNDPEMRAKLTAITNAGSLDDLGKLALSRKDLGGFLTVTKGTSSGGTIKVGAADDKVSVEMGDESFKSDSVTRDAEGNESHTYEGGTQGGMKFRVRGHEGPGASERSSIRTTVDPKGKASGETLGEKTESDPIASGTQALSHPVATTQAIARGDTQALNKKKTDTKGMSLEDQNYDRLAQLSEVPALWSKEGSHFGPKDYIAWMRLRHGIEKAHGNREVIARLLQDFKSNGDDRRRQMLEGAMDIGEGTRFEFPNAIKEQKEVWDRLVVHNPMHRAAELAEAGKTEEALADLKRIAAELDALKQTIQAQRNEISASVLGEMMSRITARRSEVRAETVGLAPQAPVKPAAADAGGGPEAAQAEAARQRELAQQKSLADIRDIGANIKMYQQKEQDTFAWVEQELNPKSEGFFGGVKTAFHTADTPLIVDKLFQLRKLYTGKWDEQLTKLREALQKAGVNPEVADKGKPNWDKLEALTKESGRLGR